MDTPTRQTPRKFIDDRGGPTLVANATGYKVGAVNLWRHRDKIPRGAWPEVMLAFGVGVEELLAMEQAGSPRTEAA